MPKYIVQLRRGWKYDADPATGEPRDDWAKYTEEKPDEAIPRPGELVLEYDNGTPRLKIGDGVHSFAELPYMSVDSFILPSPATITLLGGADHWTDEFDDDGKLIGYSQIVEVKNYTITPNSKVDIQLSPAMLSAFHNKDVTFTAVTETVDDITTVTVHVVGEMPQNTYEDIQCTITEVTTNG